MKSPPIYAVILAGGLGTRFWPASRKALPKQFLPIAGKRTMIAETAARVRPLVEWERMFVVTSVDHAHLARKLLRRIPPENILAEPVGRNTAAAVAWAALEIGARDPSAVQVVMPSDHVIRPARSFRRVLQVAVDEAEASGALMTLGIRPTSPATGFGYIETGSVLRTSGGIAVHSVARFVEKPDRARAEAFLASGRFLWNAGIFVWSTKSIVAALEKHTPELRARLASIRSDADRAKVYPTLQSVSVDVAILERAEDVRVVPIDFTWSDVGSWDSLAELIEGDADKNCAAGGVTLVAEDAHGCIAYGRKGELVALVGVQDLVVVRSGKLMLVCPRDRSQDVRRIVAKIETVDPSHL